MNETETSVINSGFRGGTVALDFANTAEWHAAEQPVEHLNNYADLVTWATGTELLSEEEARQLYQQAADNPVEADLVLKKAIDLREAIYRIFSATAAGDLPETADLALLNDILPEALVRLKLIPAGAGNFRWAWAGKGNELDRMLWPVVRSAVDLLTSSELDRVKECEDDRGCGYLFFDTSRNRSRRWCDMRGCGNRAKVRRYRRRQQDQ